MENAVDIALTVNGTRVTRRVEPREHLVDFLREQLGLTGSHTGCEHGVCGACTVRVDGQIVRGCLMLAVQANGCRVDFMKRMPCNAGFALPGCSWPRRICFYIQTNPHGKK